MDFLAYSETRYLVLLGSEKYGSVYNRINVKVDSYDSVPLEETIAFHNVVILIKSVFDKDKNNYYYDIFLENTSYELPKKEVFI